MADVPSVQTDLLVTALEHVMRCTDDELAVLPFLTAQQGSPEAFEAVGRLVTLTPTPLGPATPLAVLCNGGTVDSQWREQVGDTPRSLWSSLALLEALHGEEVVPAADEQSNPYERYLALAAHTSPR